MRSLFTIVAIVVSIFCFGQAAEKPGEYLRLDWPDSENWKVADNQENKEMRVLDLLRGSETFDNWTELGNMTLIKGVKNVPVQTSMQMTFDQSKKSYPNSKLTFIEKEEHAAFPWIIFMIESPGAANPESQLWYIVQGRESLYTNFRTIKKGTIPTDLKIKWTKFFETARIVSKIY